MNVSASAYAPVDAGFKGIFSFSNHGINDTLHVKYYFVDEDFAKVYKLEIVKGRFLQMDYSGYWKELEKRNNGKKKEKNMQFRYR